MFRRIAEPFVTLAFLVVLTSALLVIMVTLCIGGVLLKVIGPDRT